MAIQTNPADTIDQGVANLIEASIADYIDWETLSIQHHIDRDGQAGNWPQIGRDMIEEFKHALCYNMDTKEVIRMVKANPYITLSHAMEEFGLSRQTLYRLRKDGKLPEYELGGRKYLDINDLLALIKKSESRTTHDESPG